MNKQKTKESTWFKLEGGCITGLLQGYRCVSPSSPSCSLILLRSEPPTTPTRTRVLSFWRNSVISGVTRCKYTHAHTHTISEPDMQFMEPGQCLPPSTCSLKSLFHEGIQLSYILSSHRLHLPTWWDKQQQWQKQDYCITVSSHHQNSQSAFVWWT